MLSVLAALLAATPAAPVPTAPAPTIAAAQADVTLRGFAFADGSRLPALRVHYRTLGRPHRDGSGAIDNAVLLLHGTGGTGAQFLQPQFAVLFGPGQPLDTRRYFIVMPDGIGHGGSSKPSDGLRARFPNYDYADMVEAQRGLLTALGVTRLRLLFGTSMGCMHAFVWGEAHPGSVRAVMAMACQAVPIAGRNRAWRKLAIDAIRADPAWAGGDYRAQPVAGLRTAATLTLLAGMNPLRAAAETPTGAATDAWLAGRIEERVTAGDANDTIYALDASRTYDPRGGLERITMPFVWINSADDSINPPGLRTAEAMVGRMPRATFRLIPESADTRGHGTHTWAAFWSADLQALLARSEPR